MGVDEQGNTFGPARPGPSDPRSASDARVDQLMQAIHHATSGDGRPIRRLATVPCGSCAVIQQVRAGHEWLSFVNEVIAIGRASSQTVRNFTCMVCLTPWQSWSDDTWLADHFRAADDA